MEKTRETISLDSRAQHRLYVLNHVLAGELTPNEAGGALRLSTRQVRRRRGLPWPLLTIASPGLAAAMIRFVARGGLLLAEALPGNTVLMAGDS